jgi:hypothetical protein
MTETPVTRARVPSSASRGLVRSRHEGSLARRSSRSSRRSSRQGSSRMTPTLLVASPTPAKAPPTALRCAGVHPSTMLRPKTPALNPIPCMPRYQQATCHANLASDRAAHVNARLRGVATPAHSVSAIRKELWGGLRQGTSSSQIRCDDPSEKSTKRRALLAQTRVFARAPAKTAAAPSPGLKE